MTYAEFKKEHDYLVTEIVFTDAKQADTLVETFGAFTLRE
jgi:hypothetical protein